MQFELVFSLSLGEVLFSGLSCPGESEPPDDHGPASSAPDRQYTARQDVIKVHILVHVHWLAENSLYLSGPGSCFLLSTLTDLRHGMAAPRVVVGVRSGARWNFRYGSAPVIRGNSPKVEHFFRAWKFPQLIYVQGSLLLILAPTGRQYRKHDDIVYSLWWCPASSCFINVREECFGRSPQKKSAENSYTHPFSCLHQPARTTNKASVSSFSSNFGQLWRWKTRLNSRWPHWMAFTHPFVSSGMSSNDDVRFWRRTEFAVKSSNFFFCLSFGFDPVQLAC